MAQSDYYPMGAEHDPNAPYNERETELKKVKLDVYLTIHKVVEIETDKYYKFAGEVNDGEYLPPSIEFDEQEIGSDFLIYTTLPHELARLIEQGIANRWNLANTAARIMSHTMHAKRLLAKRLTEVSVPPLRKCYNEN